MITYRTSDVFSMEYHSCVFLNASGHVVPVARYSFELEHEPNHNECVLRSESGTFFFLLLMNFLNL